MPCCRAGGRATRMVGCPRHRETKQDANPLMRSCLVTSIVDSVPEHDCRIAGGGRRTQAAPRSHRFELRPWTVPCTGFRCSPRNFRMPPGAGVLSSSPLWDVPSDAISLIGGPSLRLQMALYATLTCNPDLNILRLGNPTTPSAESVEVARHFPTTLNPTLWMDYRPMILIPFEALRRPGGGALDKALLSLGATVHLPVPPPTDRAGTSDDAPLSHRPGGLRAAALDRRPGGAAGARSDLSLLSDGRLPAREVQDCQGACRALTRRFSSRCKTASRPTWFPRPRPSLPGSRAGRHGSSPGRPSKTTSSPWPTCGTRSG